MGKHIMLNDTHEGQTRTHIVYCGETAPLRFEEWLAYANHLAATDNTPYEDAEMKGISPMHLMQVELRGVTNERDKLKLQLQQLHQQATQAINQLAHQNALNNVFIAAIIHSLGGSMLVPHASFDAVRAAPHKFDEHIDNETKATRIALVRVEPSEAQADEQPAPAEAVTDVSEEAAEPVKPSLIQLVSR